MSEIAAADAGPPLFRNWQAAVHGQESIGGYEAPLLTDAHIVGDLSSGLGPYALINPVAISRHPLAIKPAIVLRVSVHLDEDSRAFGPMDRTKTETYHGGWVDDEMAALVSLHVGARVAAGGHTRRFELGGDPKGTPQAWDFDKSASIPRSVSRESLIPSASEEKHLESCRGIEILPWLPAAVATAVVKAARLYQQALWIAEVDANLAWIMLVSSIEVAASQWRTKHDLPLERLRFSSPEVYSRLQGHGDSAWLDGIASRIAPLFGSTKRFVDFVVEHLPDPPPVRPPEAFQLLWERENLERVLRVIYHWRSRALHDGTPFPAPMCDLHPGVVRGATLPEVPFGLASRTRGGTWLRDDAPVLLHTFEHLVRGSLLRWLRSQAAPDC